MPQNRSDQASLALALRNHEARLRALEANPIIGLGGDYIFIAEQSVASEGQPSLEFAAIPQSYRHLVIEARLGGATGSCQVAAQWNGETSGYTTTGQYASVTAGTPNTPATFYNNSDAGVRIACGLDIPETDLASFGPELAYAFFTLKFIDYQALNTFAGEGQPAVLFQGFGNSDDGENYWASQGGGGWPTTTAAAITDILIAETSGSGFEVGSTASLYGIA